MPYNLESLNKMLNKLEQMENKTTKKRLNKEMGYSPRCSVCNCDELDEIEKLHEDGHGYEYIKEVLDLDMSIMSLSRHFRNHYPQSQRFKRKKKIELLKNVREAFIKYPFLERYFNNKELEDLEDFNEEYGFCLDRFDLCGYIRPCTVSTGSDNIHDLYKREREEIERIKNNPYSFIGHDDKIKDAQLKYNKIINMCLNCKNDLQEQRINLIERIITYNFLGVDPGNKELYFSLLNFNGNKDEFIKIITPGK